MGQVEDNLISKGKRKKTSDAKAATCHKLANAQSASEQCSLCKTMSPNLFFPYPHFFYCWAWFYTVWNILLANLSKFFWLCPLPSSHPPPAYSLGDAPKWKQYGKKRRKPWGCAGAVWQKPKHWYVIQTVLATNPKHSNLWTAMKKFNSVPARPRTKGYRICYNTRVVKQVSLFSRLAKMLSLWALLLFPRKPVLALSRALRFYCISNINLNM